MNWTLVISLTLNAVFLMIYVGQTKKINELKREHTLSVGHHGDLNAIVKEKLKTIGDVKTIKYLRDETGMTMIEAKKLVDALRG